MSFTETNYPSILSDNSASPSLEFSLPTLSPLSTPSDGENVAVSGEKVAASGEKVAAPRPKVAPAGEKVVVAPAGQHKVGIGAYANPLDYLDLSDESGSLDEDGDKNQLPTQKKVVKESEEPLVSKAPSPPQPQPSTSHVTGSSPTVKKRQFDISDCQRMTAELVGVLFGSIGAILSAVNIGNCPVAPALPVFMMVFCVICIKTAFLFEFSRFFGKSAWRVLKKGLLITLLVFFVVVSYQVFSTKANLENDKSPNFCSKVLFNFSLSVLILIDANLLIGFVGVLIAAFFVSEETMAQLFFPKSKPKNNSHETA